MAKKAPKNKGNRIITAVFYSFYSLLILGFASAMYFFHGWLVDELIAFETATQPSVKSETIFRDNFADPDWGSLYEKMGLSDTKFEGQEAFVTYMETLVGNSELTYEQTVSESEELKYQLLLNKQPLGYFTLSNQAKIDSPIPDWELKDIHIDISREQSVTILMQEGHTAYVNGHPLDNSYTLEILSTTAEKYLPAGTQVLRRVRQQVDGLLITPEITVMDADGKECTVTYDAEADMYREEIPDASTNGLTTALENRILKAIEAYCTYMVEQDNYHLFRYFASGTDTYRAVTTAEPWGDPPTEITFSQQTISEYCRYADDLLSVRVQMTMEATYGEDAETTTEEYSTDATFFFENRKDGWVVIAMTNENITAATSRVRLTFAYEGTELSTAFYTADDKEIYAPVISGKVLSGWGSADDTTFFACSETGRLDIPADVTLKPMTLYPVFESEET